MTRPTPPEGAPRRPPPAPRRTPTSDRPSGALAIDRVERLEVVTAALARMGSWADIGALFARGVRNTFGADVGWLAVVDEGDAALRLLAAAGEGAGRARELRRVPADAPVPSADAARDGRPRWYATNADLAEEYPHHSATLRAVGIEATAVLPLRAGGARTLGVITLGFRAARGLADDDRAFAETLAQQWGHALERTRLLAREGADHR